MFQDNKSTMLLKNSGCSSSGRQTHHIQIRYFFVTDRIKKGDLRVDYCPTKEMVGNFFTKPLQGSKFKKFRRAILGIDGPPAWELPMQPPTQQSTDLATPVPQQVSATTTGGADRSVLRGEDWPSLPTRKSAQQQGVQWRDSEMGARHKLGPARRSPTGGASSRTMRAIAQAVQ